MKRQRAVIAVEVDLDPVPGWGNDAEDYAAAIRQWADNAIPHYNPTVEVIDNGGAS